MGGQPTRSPKILNIKYNNSKEKKDRNIFIEKGRIIIVIRYHKRYTLNKNIKIIYRYLSREIKKLIIYYLWLVLSM